MGVSAAGSYNQKTFFGAQMTLSTDIFGQANNTQTALSFDTKTYDYVGTMVDLVNHPTRMTAPFTGLYLVWAGVDWNGINVTNNTHLAIQKNGGGGDYCGVRSNNQGVASAPSSQPQSLLTCIYLVAGDYLEAYVLQDQGVIGGGLKVINGSANTYLGMCLFRQVFVASGTPGNAAWAGGLFLNQTASPVPPTIVSHASRSTAALLPLTSTWTAVGMDQNEFDTGGIHSTSVNNTRFTVPYTGAWLICSGLNWATSSVASVCMTGIRVNGTGTIYANYYRDSSNTNQAAGQCGIVLLLNGGDYFEVLGWQNTGSTRGIIGFASSSATPWVFGSTTLIGVHQ